MKHLFTAPAKVVAGLITLAVVTALPLSASAQSSLGGAIAQRTATPERPDSVESLEIEQTEEPPHGPTDLQIEPRPITPELEATQTCHGVLACLDTLQFCDDVGGGMSTNPDGSMTCTY